MDWNYPYLGLEFKRRQGVRRIASRLTHTGEICMRIGEDVAVWNRLEKGKKERKYTGVKGIHIIVDILVHRRAETGTEIAIEIAIEIERRWLYLL